MSAPPAAPPNTAAPAAAPNAAAAPAGNNAGASGAKGGLLKSLTSMFGMGGARRGLKSRRAKAKAKASRKAKAKASRKSKGKKSRARRY